MQVHRRRWKWITVINDSTNLGAFELMAGSRELVDHLRTVFDLCDEEKNGFITSDQLQDLGKKYFGGSEESVESLLQLLDPTGCGVIRFEEFCHGVTTIMQIQEFQQNQLTEGVEDDSLTSGVSEPSCDQGSYTTYNEYDMAEDDLLTGSQDGSTLNVSRYSPESFKDTDSAVPPSVGSGSGSPELGRKNLCSMSDGEEKYECYGEWDRGEEFQNGSLSHEKKSSSLNRNCRSNGNSFQRRNSWLRTSLRRTPSDKKRMSSNTQASQLLRSPSFNSSRRSSSCESDDMIGDVSLEDDVMDLNQKVQMLQQQITALADNQSSSNEKYSKVKQENAALMARIHSLEEQIREVEIRSEDRLQEEQKRFKELMARQDREKTLELETFTLRLHSIEKENQELNNDLLRLRAQLERLKLEKYQLQEQLGESEYSVSGLREENRHLQDLARRERDEAAQERLSNNQVIEELTKEVQELRRYRIETEPMVRARSPSMLELPSRYAELEDQVRKLREENKSLKEANEELQAQMLNSSIQEGRNLLHTGNNNSLAAEFEAMSKDEIMERLREQQEVNIKLKSYIDGILLNILENHPSILEVKGNCFH